MVFQPESSKAGEAHCGEEEPGADGESPGWNRHGPSRETTGSRPLSQSNDCAGRKAADAARASQTNRRRAKRRSIVAVSSMQGNGGTSIDGSLCEPPRVIRSIKERRNA